MQPSFRRHTARGVAFVMAVSGFIAIGLVVGSPIIVHATSGCTVGASANPGTTSTTTSHYVDGEQCLTIPAGVTSVTITAIGGQGMREARGG